MLYESECEVCGKQIRARKARRFCSKPCQYIGSRKTVVKMCACCGKRIAGSAKVVTARKYCSHACATRNGRTRYFRCDYCGREHWKPFSTRPNQKNYCNKECHRKAQSGQSPTNKTEGIQRACLICGSLFRITSSRVDRAKYCSVACLHQSMRERAGLAHPLRKQPIRLTCEWCGVRFDAKPCFADPARGKRYCSRVCVGAASCAKQQGRRSSVEVTLEQNLNFGQIQSKPQHKIGRYSVDFFIPGTNLVIEVQGDYWHNKKDVALRDARKDAYLRDRGFDVLQIWEHEIKKYPSKVLWEIGELVHDKKASGINGPVDNLRLLEAMQITRELTGADLPLKKSAKQLTSTTATIPRSD